MKLLIGLGNPEDKYAKTRHNLGFEILDEYRRKTNLGDWEIEDRFKAEVIKVGELLLARPQTYMNNSGLSVKLLADFYKVSSEDIIIIHDELDLVLGTIKIRLGGGFGGHHGVESVYEALGTDQFIRIRLGIGNLASHSGEYGRISFGAEKFVLESFMPQEKSDVKKMTKKALDAIQILLDKGLEVAQNQYN